MTCGHAGDIQLNTSLHESAATGRLVATPTLIIWVPGLMDRIAMLNEVLAQNPNDAFARYGLAMEYSTNGKPGEALEEFNKLLTAHPDYAAGYFMAAKTLIREGRTEEAKRMLTDGISAARRTGNSHAQSEMTAMLDELKES